MLGLHAANAKPLSQIIPQPFLFDAKCVNTQILCKLLNSR